jgi:DnaJ-class molecular chaperone
VPHDADVRTLAKKIPTLSYFQILGLPHRWVKAADVKKAFHAFALLYHPDQFSGEDDDARAAAKEVFKRAVESYEVLRDDALQQRYVEQYLKKGKLRLPPTAFGKVDNATAPRKKTSPPPPPKPASWVEEMETEDGREVAARVERMVKNGRVRQAQEQLSILAQIEPKNPAIKRKDKELKKLLGG